MSLTMEDLRSGRVPLKFGDPEQIAVLEEERRRQEEAIERAGGDERAENPAIEKVYHFRVEGTFTGEISVKAYDEEEAREHARMEGIGNCDDLDYDVDFYELEEVEIVQ
jgi:hypothetical protein